MWSSDTGVNLETSPPKDLRSLFQSSSASSSRLNFPAEKAEKEAEEEEEEGGGGGGAAVLVASLFF